MPRKKTKAEDAKAGPADTVPYLRNVADALGVSQDTITEWKRRGLVVGVDGAWSIVGTYLGAMRERLNPRLPRDPALLDLIDEARVATHAGDPLALADEDALPGSSAYDRLLITKKIKIDYAIAREELIGREVKNDRERIQRDQVRGTLVTKEEARAAAAAVRDAFMVAGKQLPGTVQKMIRDRVPNNFHGAIISAIDEAWEQILAELAT